MCRIEAAQLGHDVHPNVVIVYLCPDVWSAFAAKITRGDDSGDWHGHIDDTILQQINWRSIENIVYKRDDTQCLTSGQ